MDHITNKEVGVRFTDGKYAKKEDVKKELNTSLIDPIWVKIYSYRVKFNKAISLNNVAKLSYFVCFTPTIVQKINEVSARMSRALSSFNALSVENKAIIENEQKLAIIRDVALFYGETITSEVASSILNDSFNNLQSLSTAKQKTIQYYHLIRDITGATPLIDQDYLSKLYVNLTGVEGLTSPYRGFNFASNDNSYQADNNGVAFSLIDRMMTNFYNFLQDERFSIILRASSAYFFINFVKPFNSMNEELALFIFKSILASNHFETIAYLLPFERFLVHHKEFLVEFKEVARGSDMTYVLIKCVDLMNEVLEDFLDLCVNHKMEALVEEHNHDQTFSETKPNIIDVTPSKESVSTTNEENITPPVIKKVISPAVSYSSPTVAFTNLEANIEEKDAHKFEKYLLEKDPDLKPKQAHFLARHCTLGSFYTIQMFKKKEHVVYETARTSMDGLANLGYYIKKQVKNKFVYTPVKINRK